ncbi:DNA-3-methyladenine glycosylase I [Alicyclobacillus acidoterrestris]|uniref:DNA-3-methyladenine glycosylase I n=1 Tax=Alicyclobacillus suci TaxID=2816080 RepID=UPI0011943EA5|nr:DNA-3-methyladenine glycosylase I [Alicyclobacillus suci]GEO25382.1 DNA-3-methyladenine glycosylase I [Alicyclobacillus acidoterrestris]
MMRCGWVNDDPLYIHYHDVEWGVPVYDDTKLFEFFVLEGAQAGLSWYTILKKREHYRVAFDGFDVRRVAQYGDDKVAQLLSVESGIVRNRLKVASAIRNANAFLRVQEEFGTFADYLWGFVDGKPLINHWESLSQVPTRTDLSDQVSRDLKRRGFNFVGTTILYAYLQAVGIVMDHVTTCFRYRELGGKAD